MSNITAAADAPPVIAAGSEAIVARDFPGWLPPMLVKELRQGLRTRGFVGTLVGFQLLMLVLTLIALSTENSESSASRVASVALTGFFWVAIAVQLILITPSRALGGLQLEVDARTLDLLMLTRLTAWRVVLGKWISLLAQAALLLIAMLPYLVVRYFTDNADLVEDVGRCLTLLGVCAILTAAGLWGSGVAKVARVLMAISLMLVMGNVVSTLGPLLTGRFMGTRAPFANVIELPFDILNAVLITAFFLVSAVRNIAPAAENHSLFARVLPLLSLLPVPFCEAAGAHILAERQLHISAVFLGLVLLFELASARAPMAIHWRDRYRRGPLARLVGWLTMPGWPSAFVFGVMVTALWSLMALLVLTGSSWAARDRAFNVVWLAFLGFGGVAFPAAIQSFFRTVPVPRPLLYFAGLGIPALLAGVALALAESRWKITEFKSVMETLPFSSFLFALNKVDPASATFVVQGVVVVIVILVAAWQTRSYWRQLKEFETHDREAAVASTSQ